MPASRNRQVIMIRMRGGKMVELREYMNAALAEARLEMEAE